MDWVLAVGVTGRHPLRQGRRPPYAGHGRFQLEQRAAPQGMAEPISSAGGGTAVKTSSERAKCCLGVRKEWGGALQAPGERRRRQEGGSILKELQPMKSPHGSREMWGGGALEKSFYGVPTALIPLPPALLLEGGIWVEKRMKLSLGKSLGRSAA